MVMEWYSTGERGERGEGLEGLVDGHSGYWDTVICSVTEPID